MKKVKKKHLTALVRMIQELEGLDLYDLEVFTSTEAMDLPLETQHGWRVFCPGPGRWLAISWMDHSECQSNRDKYPTYQCECLSNDDP